MGNEREESRNNERTLDGERVEDRQAGKRASRLTMAQWIKAC